MIGNDVIDLHTAAKESNWRRKGFLDKLFTEKEKKEITESETPETLVWIFWSMKEATYKAHQRRFDLSPSYNPKSFSCRFNFENQASGVGEVNVNDLTYFIKTTITNSFVYSIACAFASAEIRTGIGNPGQAKPELTKVISENKNISEENIEIKKDQNFIPHYYFYGSRSSLNFSFSHHGNFSAYAYELRNI